MKIDYRGFYLYIGWNGIIVALNFDFRGKNHDVSFHLSHYGEENDREDNAQLWRSK